METPEKASGDPVRIGLQGDTGILWLSTRQNWQRAVQLGDLTPGTFVQVERGGETTRLPAGDVPELAACFPPPGPEPTPANRGTLTTAADLLAVGGDGGVSSTGMSEIGSSVGVLPPEADERPLPSVTVSDTAKATPRLSRVASGLALVIVPALIGGLVVLGARLLAQFHSKAAQHVAPAVQNAVAPATAQSHLPAPDGTLEPKRPPPTKAVTVRMPIQTVQPNRPDRTLYRQMATSRRRAESSPLGHSRSPKSEPAASPTQRSLEAEANTTASLPVIPSRPLSDHPRAPSPPPPAFMDDEAQRAKTIDQWLHPH